MIRSRAIDINESAFQHPKLRAVRNAPGSEALAQQDIHSSHAIDEGVVPLVDGSQHPDLIPDDVAIRALMQTLRVSPNPDEAALKRLRSQIDRAGLSTADMQILVRELGKLDVRSREQETRIEAAQPSAESDRAAIDSYVEEQRKLRSLVVDHYQQLLASLSSEGVLKLQEHLLHVKSRMKIYPKPDMSGNVD